MVIAAREGERERERMCNGLEVPFDCEAVAVTYSFSLTRLGPLNVSAHVEISSERERGKVLYTGDVWRTCVPPNVSKSMPFACTV